MRTRASLEAELAARLESPSEARWMVEEVLGRAARRTGGVSDTAVRAIWELAGRRMDGEPLQYVLGTWPFRSVELCVDRRALIPRPETEQVVEVALAELVRTRARRSGWVRGGALHLQSRPPSPHQPEWPSASRGGPVVVDLGTGTGAIALSIAAEVDDAAVWATDVDEGALSLAAENRSRLGADHPAAAERVRLRRGRWFDALPASLRGRVDLVVANPPYVSEEEWAGLDRVVRHEPRGALVAPDGTEGTPGFAAVEEVLRGARDWLAIDGSAVVEHAEHQAAPARALAGSLGFRDVRSAPDLAGRERALVGRR